jgi:cytochrome P450
VCQLNINIDDALTELSFFVTNDPQPIWKRLRSEDPVHWTQGLLNPFWSVIRYNDIVAVFCEPNLFSSMHGLIVPSSAEMEQLTPEMMVPGR